MHVITVMLKPRLSAIGTLHVSSFGGDHVIHHLILRIAIGTNQPHLRTCLLLKGYHML
jgi:hypothetical protein